LRAGWRFPNPDAKESLNKFSVFSADTDKVMGAGGEIRKT
jgi:hypothetical protein